MKILLIRKPSAFVTALIAIVLCVLQGCVSDKYQPRGDELSKEKQEYVTDYPTHFPKQHPILYGEYQPPPITEAIIRKIFHSKEPLSWKSLGGGSSGAHLYVVDAGSESYVVRRTGGIFGKIGIKQEVVIFEQASRAGLAPRLVFSDRDDGLIVMHKMVNLLPPHFAPGLMSAWPQLLDAVAELMRGIHDLKPDPSIVSDRYMDEYFRTWADKINPSILSSSDRAIFEKFAKTEWPRGDKVLSHNDLHARNLLYDGQRLLAVDWEASGWGPRLYDVALFVNRQVMTNAEGMDFLARYLRRKPTSQEHFRFTAMRQLNAVFQAAGAFLNSKKAPADTLANLLDASPVTTVRNLILGLDQGIVKGDNPHHQYVYGVAQLRFAEYFVK